MANAQYVIDVAARMTGEETADEIAELSSEMLGAGKDAEYFQRAIAQVSSELKEARAANEAAIQALAGGKSVYAELERGALQAAKAAERAALKNGGVVPHELAAASAKASAELEHQAHALASLEAHAAAAATREKTLAQTFNNTRTLISSANRSITGQAEALEKLRSGLSVAGPVGRLGSSLLAPVQGFAKLSSEMGRANAAMLLSAAAISGVIVAVVALTAALVAATVAAAAWAVGLADSNRNARLSAEAFDALNPKLAPLRASFAGLTAETGVSADELQGLAKGLSDAKVSATDMPAALRAAALAEAALGKGGGSDFISKLKAGKQSARELANEYNTKLGPIVAQQMRGLSAHTISLR